MTKKKRNQPVHEWFNLQGPNQSRRSLDRVGVPQPRRPKAAPPVNTPPRINPTPSPTQRADGQYYSKPLSEGGKGYAPDFLHGLGTMWDLLFGKKK